MILYLYIIVKEKKIYFKFTQIILCINFKAINADCKETVVYSFRSNSARFFFI